MGENVRNNIRDRVGVWLDENIETLGNIERLMWPHQDVITMVEALRPRLFDRICAALAHNSNLAKRRKAIKFPTSAISRVGNAISHLRRFSLEEAPHRDVVFLPQNLTQLAHQLPVARSLSESDRTCGFMFPSPSWEKGMSMDGVDVIPYTRALKSQLLCSRLKARVMWLRLSREERLPVQPLHLEDADVDLGPILLEAVLHNVNAVFEKYTLAKYLLDYVRPKLFAVSDELTPGTRTLVALAKKNGVRCVEMVGSAGESPMDSYRQCDRFVVFGNHAKRALAACGIDIKKIKACGAPYLDELALKRPLPFLSRTQDMSDAKHLFYLVDVSDKWAPVFRRFAQMRNGNFVLFLSGCTSQILKNDLRTARNFKLCQRSGLSGSNLGQCLKAADIVITDKIAQALEAISIGKKVMAFNICDTFDDAEFLKTRLAPVIENEVDLLQPFCESEHGDLGVRQSFEDFFLRKDGNSAGRVANVLVEECQK